MKSEAALKGTASNGYVWIGIVAIEAAPCNGFKTHHQRFQSHPLRYSRAHDIKKRRGARRMSPVTFLRVPIPVPDFAGAGKRFRFRSKTAIGSGGIQIANCYKYAQ